MKQGRVHMLVVAACLHISDRAETVRVSKCPRPELITPSLADVHSTIIMLQRVEQPRGLPMTWS